MDSTKTVVNEGKSASFYPLRLVPGEEIVTALQKFVKSTGIKAAFIATCCGSVTKAKLRFAFKPERGDFEEAIKEFNQHFEIVSMVGTVCEDGSHHLHISLADAEGSVIGGHVMGDLCVFTTAEIVLGHCGNFMFTREMDPNTGYPELKVTKMIQN